MRTLVREMRERSVFRALATYAVVAWLLLQIADVTFDRLPIPDGAMTILIVLVIIGFPVTLVLAWGYEVTLQGVVRHEETAGGAPRLALLQFASIVAAVVIVATGAVYFLSKEQWAPARLSIAVLPFANATAAADTEYFSDGLTEEIRSLIVRLNEFRVVSLSAAIQLKGTVLDVSVVADRLDADVVLQGSVRRHQEQVSITARLFDGVEGIEIWSETYDRRLADVFSIQEDIARQVARALHIVLPVAADERLKRLGTKNVESYDLYLRGLDLLRRPKDIDLNLQSLQYLRQSVALDPGFANAHAAICEVYLENYSLAHDVEDFGEAEQACRMALERDPGASAVHLALGNLYRTSGKYEVALHEFEEALSINANSAEAYIGLGRTQAELGQLEAAEKNLRRAIAIDVSNWLSFSAMGSFLFSVGRFLEAAEFFQMYLSRVEDSAPALNNLGAAYYLAGDFAEAASAWERSLEVKPTHEAYSNTGSMYFYLGDFVRAAERYSKAVELMPLDYQLWGDLGDAYFYTDDLKEAAQVAYERAISICEQKLEINPSDPEPLADLAYYYSRVDRISDSRETITTALGAAPDDMYVHYFDALIHAHLGEIHEALDALERAIELQYEVDLLSLDPGLKPLIDEQRFRKLIRQDKK